LKTDPRIDTLFRNDRPLRSLEFFPPKDDAGLAALRQTASALQAINPDFASVTYGAGGGTRERTAQVTSLLRKEFGMVAIPHLTCVNHTPDQIVEIVASHHRNGIRNIMALRGDVPKNSTTADAFMDGLRFGTDIVALIQKNFPDICCGVAGYPEKHPEAPDFDVDVAHLKEKVDAGGSFITTQLFFDNSVFHRFVDRCRSAGISVPIIPGIMPPLSLSQIKRMTEMSGSAVPRELSDRMAAAGGDPETAEQTGIDWTINQLRELIEHGIPGYHLYILNRARSALALAKGLSA
jgi:methylenetetrahydrofolate reductase (NADPH)